MTLVSVNKALKTRLPLSPSPPCPWLFNLKIQVLQLVAAILNLPLSSSAFCTPVSNCSFRRTSFICQQWKQRPGEVFAFIPVISSLPSHCLHLNVACSAPNLLGHFCLNFIFHLVVGWTFQNTAHPFSSWQRVVHRSLRFGPPSSHRIGVFLPSTTSALPPSTPPLQLWPFLSFRPVITSLHLQTYRSCLHLFACQLFSASEHSSMLWTVPFS